jgi:hypothetical protein
MIYISSNNGGRPVTKTFTPLHFTSLLKQVPLLSFDILANLCENCGRNVLLCPALLHYLPPTNKVQ